MTTWKKWNYLILAGGWLLSMVYEAFWNPDIWITYLIAGFVVTVIFIVCFFWQRRKEFKEKMEGKQEPVSPYVFFATALAVLVLFVLSLRRMNDFTPPHIPLLPLYVVLLGDCLVFGMITRRKAEAGKKEDEEEE